MSSENGFIGIFVGSGSFVEDNRVNANPGGGIDISGDNSTVRNNELSGNAGGFRAYRLCKFDAARRGA